MPQSPERGWVRRVAIFVAFAAFILVAWEGVKFVGGDPWRTETWVWEPPLEIWFASDLLLPHVWDIFGALAAPVQRGSDASLAQFLVGAAAYTWREARHRLRAWAPSSASAWRRPSSTRHCSSGHSCRT